MIHTDGRARAYTLMDPLGNGSGNTVALARNSMTVSEQTRNISPRISYEVWKGAASCQQLPCSWLTADEAHGMVAEAHISTDSRGDLNG